ncbi:unnamed protein product [Durusdinium trenchii]|uniref:J domain-containing protein n=1 Tax=Durusdinium trenchii TaxID=1381693 RepID=A0ABP0HQT3_9DINO
MVESDGDDTLYEILGIDEDAPLDDVVKAYRQRALAEHPDKGGDVDRFDALKKAYEVLSDQQKRQAYDEKLAKDREREELVEGGPSGGYSKQQVQAPMARVKTAPTFGSKRQGRMRTAQPGSGPYCPQEWKGMGSGQALLKMLTDDITAEEKTQKLLEQYVALPRCKERRQEWASGLRGKDKQDLKAAAKKKEQQERAKWSAWLSNGVQAAKADSKPKAKAKSKSKPTPKPRPSKPEDLAPEELAPDSGAEPRVAQTG